jgi:hypothetical protein
LLLFLYTGWHVRDEGSLAAGLRVAFIDTRAYRADHEHEREAAMLQTELHYAADTDKIVDEMLANLLGYTQGASRVQLGVVHNGIRHRHCAAAVRRHECRGRSRENRGSAFAEPAIVRLE